MKYTLKIETYEAISSFEDWLTSNIRNEWQVEFSDMDELEEDKAMNKAKKKLIFRFETESDKEAFKDAYLKRRI